MQCLPDHSSLMTSTTPTTSLLAEELALGGMTMHVSWNGLKWSSAGVNDASGIKGPLRIELRGPTSRFSPGWPRPGGLFEAPTTILERQMFNEYPGS